MNWQSDTNAVEQAFAPILEPWYERHKRDLPWRHTTDPYRIWLSEIILQQTRVAQGRPYYERFVETYPTVADMARAEEQHVLRLWQGLGYYSRARNLHHTARFVTGHLSGKFPDSYRELLKMKGIGSYTAAAIASFAFGERVAVVDGNVYRVLARVFGITDDITTTPAKKTFAALAARLIAHASAPATYNQAIMEFGAIQCTPVAPDCLFCPLQQHCTAYQTGQQRNLPVKARKAPVRERFINYLVFQQHGQLALRERLDRDIWQNLFDFYSVETDEPVADLQRLTLPGPVDKLVQGGLIMTDPVREVQLLSHQRIKAVFHQIELPDASNELLPDGMQWYKSEQIGALPKPVLITNYLARMLV